ncbi:receptor like protein 44 [Artemisia annua]|uniref:Receptor like protein 44 n=1 Tax=Artemisia annua TaxID=35608 RepID=A0A2U1N6R9_ARTAN|nr:receptor like protein 44 [Artemisia annua]
MRFTKLKLIISLLICSIFLPPSSPDPNDESCLTNLFNSIQDPDHNLQNWTKPTFQNPCSGFLSNLVGATCNNGRIYKLSLINLNLHGTISPFISNCTNLQSLDLSNNSLTGIIPPDLRLLVNLAVLNLSSNHLSGDIPPTVANCIYLNVIDLHENELTGTIPFQFGSLMRLSVFDVSNNKLTGLIPASLGNRTGNLNRFNLSWFRMFRYLEVTYRFNFRERLRGSTCEQSLSKLDLPSRNGLMLLTFGKFRSSEINILEYLIELGTVEIMAARIPTKVIGYVEEQVPSLTMKHDSDLSRKLNGFCLCVVRLERGG